MLKLQNIKKTYEQNHQQVPAVDDVSLQIKDGEFAVLLGPSGCGKTTLLKIAGGLLKPTDGDVLLDNNAVSEPSKNLGMVFQNFSLFPWLTVKGNINFGLKESKVPRAEREKIVEHYLRLTGLQEFSHFYPKDLSGGMQQRVAIARTLANDPKVLLMDEPFGSLDAQTRSHMQEFLLQVWEQEHKTILFVTHDVSEAVFLADTVYVLSSRPAKVKETFQVHFKRPRSHGLKHSQGFFETRKIIDRALGNEQ